MCKPSKGKIALWFALFLILFVGIPMLGVMANRAAEVSRRNERFTLVFGEQIGGMHSQYAVYDYFDALLPQACERWKLQQKAGPGAEVTGWPPIRARFETAERVALEAGYDELPERYIEFKRRWSDPKNADPNCW